MKKPLTSREKIIMKFISIFMVDNEFAPQQSEIARGLKIKHRQSVRASLLSMQKKGWITLGRSGEIKIVGDHA